MKEAKLTLFVCVFKNFLINFFVNYSHILENMRIVLPNFSYYSYWRLLVRLAQRVIFDNPGHQFFV